MWILGEDPLKISLEIFRRYLPGVFLKSFSGCYSGKFTRSVSRILTGYSSLFLMIPPVFSSNFFPIALPQESRRILPEVLCEILPKISQCIIGEKPLGVCPEVPRSFFPEVPPTVLPGNFSESLQEFLQAIPPNVFFKELPKFQRFPEFPAELFHIFHRRFFWKFLQVIPENFRGSSFGGA